MHLSVLNRVEDQADRRAPTDGAFEPLAVEGGRSLPRSVRAAMQAVRADHARPWTVEALASAAGVAPETLRKNFKLGLDLTVGEFVNGVRLDWARERLSSGREWRPISALALASGFSGGSLFSRAYVRRFGEAPSLTRGRAVRAMT